MAEQIPIPSVETEHFVIEYALKVNGVPTIIRKPFAELPDWAKTILYPEWDHPSGCECHPCWLQKENTK